MIRRTFKARLPRNIILNKFYKVWWNLSYTSIIKQNRNILLTKLNTVKELNLLMDRKNIIVSNNIYLNLKPNSQIYDIKGYKPKRLVKLIKKKYEVSTSWQTKQKFINNYSNAKFNNFSYINNYKIINSLIQQKNFFISNKLFTNLIKFNILTNSKIKKKRFLINKKWNHFNMVSKQQYSLRERFARILINRNKLNYQHSYFVESVTRHKI